jgi:hypothetical protein
MSQHSSAESATGSTSACRGCTTRPELARAGGLPEKVSWISPFPVFREKGCPACHLFPTEKVSSAARSRGRGEGKGVRLLAL